jgi:murein DD-endopeptidase MepM/ murein hydrolase activator NlpD
MCIVFEAVLFQRGDCGMAFAVRFKDIYGIGGMKKQSVRVGMAVVLLLSGGAQGQAVQMANAENKRFIPLQAVRPAPVMRSDTQAMRQGFMRIDREMLVVQVPRGGQHKVSVVRPQQDMARAQKNTGDAATIFGPEPVVDGTGFARAMRGVRTTVSKHLWPIPRGVAQRLSSAFGMRKDPFTGKPTFHGGIDIAVAPGTPVLASGDGTVSEVSSGGGFGKHVSIKHADGSTSMYGHLSGQNARVGQRVRQGQVIGTVGSTGRSTGPHLDYRISKNGQKINPMHVLNAPLGTTRLASSAIPNERLASGRIRAKIITVR